MADNITYRFIQNVGDYFPAGYFTDDFINKVQTCAGVSADEMKALCNPYVQIRGEYEEYKNFIINARARKEDQIKHTHECRTEHIRLIVLCQSIIQCHHNLSGCMEMSRQCPEQATSYSHHQ